MSTIAHNPFRSILHLSAGDFLAKILHFFTFIYLARTLGVSRYGVLEFAYAGSMYFLFLADAGIEGWATREASKTPNARVLAGRVLPLRIAVSICSFLLLLLMIPLFPDYPQLRALLFLFGASAFLQALNLKWSLLAGQKMAAVGAGFVLMQMVFAVVVFFGVRGSEDLLRVAIARLLGDFAATVFYGVRFFIDQGGWPGTFTFREAMRILRPAVVIGASSFIALMSFNFDSVFLGFLMGPEAVAWYSAAYKPVSMTLAVSSTYFIGLLPVLSRQFVLEPTAFEQTIANSLRLTAVLAVPIVVGGALMAEPVIDLLFGPDYSRSAPVLKILIWSALAVILRGTLRQGFVSADQQALELRCALIAISFNVVLNIVLIPRFGIVGAAIATVVAEAIWFALLRYYFSKSVTTVRWMSVLWRPVVSGCAMAAFLIFTNAWPWMLSAFLATAVYGIVLFALGERPSTEI